MQIWANGLGHDMTETITQQLNEVFLKASLSYVRKVLTSIDDFEKLSEITQNAEESRNDLTRRYNEEYESRVDAERQRLHHQAAQVKLDHPAPRGAPITDKDTIILQAHEQVRLAHETDLRGVADDEQRQIEDLLERAHQRNQTQGVATDAFLRAGDRRSGQDRRIQKQSQD
jgi:hypothetical protein